MRSTSVMALVGLSSVLWVSVAAAQDLIMDSPKSQHMSPPSMLPSKSNVPALAAENLNNLALISKDKSEYTGAKPTVGLLNAPLSGRMSRGSGQASESGDLGNAMLSNQKLDMPSDLKTSVLLGIEQASTHAQDKRDLSVTQSRLLGR